jgi:hypothetical protein
MHRGGYRPLVLTHEIVSLPSASAFALQRRNLENRKPAAKSVAVIADPVFSIADARLKSESTATRSIEHLPADRTGGSENQAQANNLVEKRRDDASAALGMGSTDHFQALPRRLSEDLSTGTDSIPRL